MVSLSGGFSYESARNREWLVANGIGGYASSTVIGANTRKYHGLLVASKNPPVERRVLLAKLEEAVKIGSREYSLSTNKYPGVVHPKGYENLESFSLSPFPTFGYSFGSVRIRKTVFMVHGKNATVARYEVQSPEPVELSIIPLANDRDFHGNTNSRLPFSQAPKPNGTVIGNSGKPFLFLESDHCAYSPFETWYVNMLYELETERAEDDSDNHFGPGSFSISIKDQGTFHIIASDGERTGADPDALYRSELIRLKALKEKGPSPIPEQLLYSADSFLVQRRSTHSGSIIAGYHWFADWGRDSMISLPGLTLATGKFEFARSVLDTFAQKISNGLVPNVFSDTGEGAAYNSADASLWFIMSSCSYLHATHDEHFFRDRLWGKIKEIIAAYRSGTTGLRMDSDFLISCDPGLTWMDAFVDGKAATPRNGKPVEINALWCNSLHLAHELANRFGERALAHELNQLEEGATASFRKFWNPRDKCLFDIIDPVDSSVRPNQIFAVSLPLQLLGEEEELVLEKVRRELLTPYGLRSLSPSDRHYRSSYSGDRRLRDFAYHNGTVWSWLIGPYADACARLKGKSEVRGLLKPLKEFIQEKGMGTVPELFDPESLEPRGCFSQAWGVAEWLRIMKEYD